VLREAEEFVVKNQSKSFWLPIAPLLILAAVCMGILLEAAMTVCVGTSSCARCIDHALTFSACGFSIVIFVVAIFVAAIIMAGVTIGTFCLNPEQNIIDITSGLANSSLPPAAAPYLVNTTLYYLAGDSLNPLLTYSSLAVTLLDDLDQRYAELQTPIRTATRLCSKVADINVTMLTTDVRKVLQSAHYQLSGPQIWPLYDDVVRQGVCNAGTALLGRMALLLTLVGLIVFPLCVIATHTFLVQWAQWEQRVEEDGIEGSDDDDLYRSYVCGSLREDRSHSFDSEEQSRELRHNAYE